MDHLAIMKKSWGLTEKILAGQKRIESRWYQTKRSPWGEINAGDTIYFKNSGELVSLKAGVGKVISFSDLTPPKVKWILDRYGDDDGIEEDKVEYFFNLFKNKRYCLLVFLKNPKRIEPFEVNKTGFGAMTAWITTDNIDKIKV